MSIEGFAEREQERLGARLTGIYGRWTLGYLLGMLVLWVVGIEALYGHPTPFYALLSPAFESVWVFLITIGAIWLAALIGVNAVAWRKGRSVRRIALSFLPWALYVLLLAVAYGQDAAGKGASGEAMALLGAPLGRNLGVLLVYLAFLASVTAALRQIRWFEEEPSSRATGWLLVGLIFFAFVFSGAVAGLRDGFDGITQAYERYRYEYISDIGFGGSIRGLFADYVPKHEYLSMHGKVHPPGPTVVLWILSYVAGREPLGLSLATMAFGSLAVVPLYFWVKDLLGRRAALTACMVWVLVPSVVLFTATSADILFMPFVFTTLFLFGRAIDRASVGYALGAGVLYAAMSLLSFSLLSVGAYFGFVGLWRLLDPARRKAVIQTAVLMFAALVAVHLAVRLWSGFDVIEAFRLAKAQFDEDQVNLDRFTPRYPAWTWKFLNPLAWFYFAGIPVSLLFLARLRRPGADTRALFIVFALTFVALDLLYLGRGEGERSALYVFPFLVVPAAHALDAMGAAAASRAPLVATLSFLAFQCWLTESLFYTYW